MSLETFVRESNKIEGIMRDPSNAELDAHRQFLLLGGDGRPNVGDMERFVSIVQPNAVLRRSGGLDVRVGDYIAPYGGPAIEAALEGILGLAQYDHPFDVHQRYETLHPFTDGNGRSGRMLWLWMMSGRADKRRALELGFLHLWYYQSLSKSRAPT